MVAQRGEGDAEAAPVGWSDGDLDQLGVPARVQHPALAAPARAVDLQHERLVAQAGVDQQTGGLPHRHRGALDQQQLGQRHRGGAPSRHQELPAGLIGGAEVVGGLVVQPVGAGAQIRQLDRGDPVGTVGEHARRQLLAAAPAGQDLLRRDVRFPARAEPVPGRPVAALARRLRQRLVGGSQGAGGLLQAHQPPAALSRPRGAVQVGAEDGQAAALAGEEEADLARDACLHRHEAEPEDAAGGAGLAALVGDIHAQPEGVGDALLGLALVGLRGEAQGEGAVLAQARLPRGHNPLLGRPWRVPPEPPGGEDRLPRDPPAHVPRDHRQAEVVAGRA